MALMVPMTATAAYDQLADGVYMDGATLYITSGVTSLGDLQVNPSEIYCYATTPPDCVSNPFSGYGATLHVPAASMVSYFTAAYWSNFNNILSDAIEPQSITVSAFEVELVIGHQLSLSASVTPNNATPTTVNWSSTDASVATVNNGKVTAIASGECDILATCVDKVAVCHVKVVPPHVTITLDKHEARLRPNETLTLTATCSPMNVDLSVASSNQGVAIPRLVNGNIMVVGVSEGTAVITVNAADGNGDPDSCTVIVYSIPGDVNGDEEVNIADVNALIDAILGNSYYITADVNKDGEIDIADVNAVIDIILGAQTQLYVDLGLPSGTLWAKRNVGADSPEGNGNFFAWGEIRQKEKYSWSTYLWCNGTSKELKKYCTTGDYGTVDNKIELDPEDDAAYVNWGESWRMPTYDQFEELRTHCMWKWTQQNGVKGCLVTGPNGNTMFLPAAGDRSDASYYSGAGFYWTRTLDSGNPSHAYNLFFGSSEVSWYYYTRERGLSVRPVSASRAGFYIDKQSVDFGLVPVEATCTDTLTLVNRTMKDITVTATVEKPFSLIQGEECDSSLTFVVPSRTSIPLTVIFNDTTPGQFNSNIIIQKPAYDEGQFVIPVHLLAYAEPSAQQESVDLGLPSHTLWASCNVGANSPEEYGNFYAWGETAPKSNYGWSTYKWANGRFNALTKYVTNGSYGYRRDNISELELADDAARAYMGSPWRIPTPDQISELKGKCTWLWTTMNDVNGYLVIGPNCNTIFLPAAGYKDYSTHKHAGTNGYYWSNKINIIRPCEASFMSFNSPDGPYSSTLYDSGRSTGLTVRAVCR